jgi:hypothetical protein
MPETVPEGCVRMTGWKNADGIWSIGPNKESFDTHFAILRLPAAEGAPPAEPEPEPAAQVPLGPEDCPPGSVIFAKGTDIQAMVVRVCDSGMWIYGITGHAYEVCFQEAFYDWQINTSIPDTGRWDANAWRDCSKPGKEVAK